MSELTLEGLRNYYIKKRLEHLPNGGDYMTVIQQDSIIDVHDLVGKEFDTVIAAAKAEAWDEGFDAGWDEREDFVMCGAIPSGKHQSEVANPYRT